MRRSLPPCCSIFQTVPICISQHKPGGARKKKVSLKRLERCLDSDTLLCSRRQRSIYQRGVRGGVDVLAGNERLIVGVTAARPLNRG